MQTKHTPGPWQYAKSMMPGRYTIYHNGPLAYCGDTSASPGDGEANARLIAAAPELLAALDKIQAAASRSIDFGDTETLRDFITQVAASSRAAIAKATGAA